MDNFPLRSRRLYSMQIPHWLVSFAGRARHSLMVIAAGGLVLSSAACDSPVDSAKPTLPPTFGAGAQPGAGVPPRPQPPTFEARTPTYPALALYIVFREYVNKHPGIRYLDPEDREYQKYMEKRLRELYPQRGYAGMMKDAVEEMRRNKAAWRKYEQETHDYMVMTCDMMTRVCDDGSINYPPDPSWDGQEEFPSMPDNFIPSIAEEADSLQLTQEEVDRLYYYESLAQGTYRTASVMGTSSTRDDLIRAAAVGRLWSSTMSVPAPADTFENVHPIVVGFLGLARDLHRAQLSMTRAYERTAAYYGDARQGDTRGDAFRHMFWNVQMRRYLTYYTAKAISDYHEKEGAYGPNGEYYTPGPWSSIVMDLHNNMIGLDYRYKRFRGAWWSDRNNWFKWSFLVAQYVNDGANGEFVPEWAVPPYPTEEQARQREAYVLNWKYIYFR